MDEVLVWQHLNALPNQRFTYGHMRIIHFYNSWGANGVLDALLIRDDIF